MSFDETKSYMSKLLFMIILIGTVKTVLLA